MAAKHRSDVLRVNFDPALGDLALAEARDQLAQGDWDAARDLLSASRGDWDRRSHRVRVLAEAVANSAWVERWQVLDPVSPDAALLRAQVETVRVLRASVAAGSGSTAGAGTGSGFAAGTGSGFTPGSSAAGSSSSSGFAAGTASGFAAGSVSGSGFASGATTGAASADEARAACRHAAEMAPDDPTPWVVMLTLARAVDRAGANGGATRGRDMFWRDWQEMRSRDPFNRDGQHEALTYLTASWCGSHAEMYDFAYWLAGEAPPGSPLAVLPLVAHGEAYRAMCVGAPSYAPPSPHTHWGNPQVVTDVERVMRSWLGTASTPHAQADMDRNHLLHAMVFSGYGEGDEARALFDAIGSHAMRVPWSYTGDPESSFLYWRSRAFGVKAERR